MEKGSRILIALDDSLHSTYAFEWYMDHMHRPDHEVIIGNSPQHAHIPPTPVVSMNHSQLVQEGEREVTNIIKHTREKLDKAGVNAKLLRLTGEAGPSVVRAAIEHQVDCIITGSRGLGTVKRTLIGSVSDYILHHAHCPVLICQRRERAKTK